MAMGCKSWWRGWAASTIWCFTAGNTLQLGSLASTDVGAARRAFELRYWGAYLAAKYGSGNIRAGGSIVFTSGTAGQRPRTGWTRSEERRVGQESRSRWSPYH